MAGLRRLPNKPGGWYYARISMNNGKSEDIIGLNTKSKELAKLRKNQVEQFEPELKQGVKMSWIWQGTKASVKLDKWTLKMAVEKYLNYCGSDRIRESTLDIYGRGLNRFIVSFGKKTDVDRINISSIDNFKVQFKHLQPATVNMDLRTLKAFLIWLKDRKRLNELPKIKMVKDEEKDSLPGYLSNAEFQEICNRVDPHHARAYWFYRETGLRLSEPFNGTIDGNFFKIKARDYKGRHDHIITLTPELKAVLIEMQSMVKEKVNLGISTKENAVHMYTKNFWKACRGDEEKGLEPITDKKLHSLRHTCAVRLYLKTRDIYAVQRQLGHRSITTTEIYSKFNIEKLQQDFPDLVQQTPENVLKTVKIGKADTGQADTRQQAYA